MRYKLIAIDLDGTLLGPDGRVSDANANAIARAQDAGVVIVPCTGRAWHESHWAIDRLTGIDRGVFVTGGMISDMASGRTLDAAAFVPQVAGQLIDLLAELPDAVLVFRDRDRVGYDYLIAGQGQLTPNTAWWFEHSGAKVARELRPADVSHIVRVAMVSHNGGAAEAYRRVCQALPGQVNAHCFGGIARTEQNESVEIVEVFPPGVDKWRGVLAVAEQHGIDASQIAAIGDEINDVPMLKAAALGVAMGNAVQAAAAVADRTTLPNTHDGVAHAIDQMLSAAW